MRCWKDMTLTYVDSAPWSIAHDYNCSGMCIMFAVCLAATIHLTVDRDRRLKVSERER